MKKKILFVTCTRADYGKLKSTIIKIQKNNSFISKVFVSGMHTMKRYGSTYYELVKEFLGIELSKQLQSTDFGGNLNEKQLKYCANDVIYLHKIRDDLNKMLIRENRFELYESCIKFLKTRIKLDQEGFSEDIFSH